MGKKREKKWQIKNKLEIKHENDLYFVIECVKKKGVRANRCFLLYCLIKVVSIKLQFV